MKIIAISDTHLRHRDVKLPGGDILIHSGDITSRGSRIEIIDFLDWYSAQPHQHKILIAGNHDFWFESRSADAVQLIPDNIIYLENSSVIIEDIHIWGSPIQPWFNDWAFNRQRGAEIKRYWDRIPNDTDILITHGPPHGILDKNVYGKNVGCEELRLAVNRIKPRCHIFGHVHEGYGINTLDQITFINASLLNANYFYTNDPIIFEYIRDEEL